MSTGPKLWPKDLGLFARAVGTTPLPMVFTDAQAPDDCVVFANDAFVTLTGLSRAAIVGEPLDAALSCVSDSASLSTIRVIMERVDNGTCEMSCHRIDGSEFSAAVYFSAVQDEEGAVRQHFFVFVERGGDDERLNDQRNALHALYAQAPGFIATSTGPGHRFSFANAAYKRFVARGDLVGKTVAEVMPEMIDQGFVKVLDEVYRTGKPYSGTAIPMGIVVPETGEIEMRFCDFVYQPVRDATGRITGLFCEGYDVTKQRETADQLSMLQAQMIHLSRVNAMGTMATTLAHELNHPLAAIGNYAAGVARLCDAGSPDVDKLAFALRGIQEA
ncbi:MAG: PAS domain-containing protein, partial [Mesorhizobium sp.]|nr:PAS domain-containing protein [Mesorhizobium sp.]